MKTATVPFVTLLLYFCAASGQSTTQKEFVHFRADMKSELGTTIDPKKFMGTWVSLQGDVTLKIYQQGTEILVGGAYFPGVANQGDKANLTIQPYPRWMKKDPALRKIEIFYKVSPNFGGGGGEVKIAYSPSMDYLIIGTPPYNVFENGQWVGHLGRVASNGIYGREFKRVTSPAAQGRLHIDVIRIPPAGFGNLDCTYTKSPGGLPVLFTSISGEAVIKIDGELIFLKLEKTGTDKAGNLKYTFAGSGFKVSVKTGPDLKKGSLSIINEQKIGRLAIIGGCRIDAGD